RANSPLARVTHNASTTGGVRMTEKRTREELAELRAEAERRVRSGEAQLEVAHDLDVPPTTLSGWATRGGWRRRDLDREVYEERARIAAKTRESMQAIEKPPRPK